MDAEATRNAAPVRDERRFQWVTAGLNSGPCAPFDVELRRSDDALVIPTMGSIVPGWLLVIPRTLALCFATLPPEVRHRIRDLTETVRLDMRQFGSRAFLFEHGAYHSRSVVGCGVDQAHLHLVCLESDLVNFVLNDGKAISWSAVDAEDPWSNVHSGQEYYLISDFERAYIAYPQEPESQYFRKLIARGVGRAEEWDYRQYRHERNALETIGKFAKQRDCG